jgi:hypothetical protein
MTYAHLIKPFPKPLETAKTAVEKTLVRKAGYFVDRHELQLPKQRGAFL